MNTVFRHSNSNITERKTPMNRFFSITKGAFLGIILAASALTLAGHSGYPAHAASPPQINALGLGGSARVWGFNFAPNSVERVQLLDKASHVLATKYVGTYSNGQLPWTQIDTSYVGPVVVRASRYQCIRFGIRNLCSYWTQSSTRVYVYSAPHIDQATPNRHPLTSGPAASHPAVPYASSCSTPTSTCWTLDTPRPITVAPTATGLRIHF